jgi:hypothetical protein
MSQSCFRHGDICWHKETISTDNEVKFCLNCEQKYFADDLGLRVYIHTWNGPKWITEEDYEIGIISGRFLIK